MSLTSATLLLFTACCTALLFTATVWLWPRLARQGWRSVLGRVALVLAVQALVFSSIGLAVNRSMLVYGSWADLLGTARPAPLIAGEAGAAGEALVKVTGRRQPDVPGGMTPQVGGEIQQVTVQGRQSKVATSAYVYLPPEYFQPGNEKRTFPAAVVLTGYPGTAENLLGPLRYPQAAWTLAKQRKIQPMVLILMRPTVGPRNTQCVDVPDGPAAETFFSSDLPQAISGAYRVGAAARSWAIMGDSTGGYCALKVALQHPEHYAAGVGLSADYKPEIDGDSGDLFHGNKDEEKRSDLLWSLDNLPQGKSSFLVTTSLQGESNLGPTRKFIEKVKAPARVSSITLDHGGHSFNTWNREIPPSLEWLSGRLAAP
ncbi:alpha/beta hydrolase [Streptomyces sp. NPDC091268]|uniref:alpha/beta hydrolase n=1 Tax=Streptomyces sp. NPDC091268 TaxID=3365979 RepID=UPI003800F35A